MPRYNANNLAGTELSQSISSGDTSIDVNDASVFPAAPFLATIDDNSNVEIVEVTSVSSNTLTVERGKEDTTAQSFGSGTEIEQRLTAGMYGNLTNIEESQDAAWSIASGGNLISVTYDDANGSVSIDFDGTLYTDEDAQDAVGNAITVSGDGSFTYDDANNQFEFSIDAPVDSVNGSTGAVSLSTDDISEGSSNLYFSDERAQDAVGGIMTGSGATSVTYDDANNTITISSTDSDTTYSAGTGLNLSSQSFSLDESYSASWSSNHAFNAGLTYPSNGTGETSGLPTNGISNQYAIQNQIKFGNSAFTGTTSTSYLTVVDSDIAHDFDKMKDGNGNVYVNFLYHLRGDVSARIVRQNAGTVVSGSGVSASNGTQSWAFRESGWIDMSSESGWESYQVDIRSDDGSEAGYNSIIMMVATPQS